MLCNMTTFLSVTGAISSSVVASIELLDLLARSTRDYLKWFVEITVTLRLRL